MAFSARETASVVTVDTRGHVKIRPVVANRKGLIVSDDMEMGGILNYTGIAEATVRSLQAGMDVVEICRDPALVFAAYEAVLREAEGSPAFARLLRSAAAKVRAVAAARPKRLPPTPSSTAVKRMQTAIERFRKQVAKAGPA